ncbi:hypothetical protein SASPL_106998 [Salvia splendens]|uniref:Avr9/Cf-9 rapidly elicited protein 146 n=1 Tax=Salvia splendens TaxID=180675 RepID=A0A8X8YC68_SALSN|nr:uncharacterized protein LOC121795499 [Salvia splendens]KAG6428959.1 hypothetical protein SASPL_106998 [Salvia splendens]
MEQNLPIIAKKFWKIVRVLYFMLRKGISKAKLLADLSLMMKRGKIAGKAAIQNLIFHHTAAAAARPIKEYEFSCGTSPAFNFPSFKRGKRAAPAPIDAELLAAALEMMNGTAASPALPGFGPSPMVRQLRITDSPFPLCNAEDNHVDEEAERFIMKFYSDLKRQSCKSPLSY